MKPVRVLIVDDSAFVRRALERILGSVAGIEVIGAATNGREAVELVHELRPDVVVMDVNMPEMDGLEALRRIMAEMPTAVILVSTLTQPGAETTLQALELGAVDFIEKSSVGTAMDIYELGPTLCDKVLAVAAADPMPRVVAGTAKDDSAERDPPVAAGEYDVVAVGASTGGPRALSALLHDLPAGFGAAVLVAQHMPAGFTETLAARLDRHSPLSVAEAHDRDPVLPGQVLIAPGRKQMTLERSGDGLLVRVSRAEPNVPYQPSVDLLFTTVARVAGARAVGVVLTGMGDDGAQGLKLLREAGARTIVEDPRTAVIYGMPRAARPFAETSLPLGRIGPYLAGLCARNATPGRSEA
jgi:two-component system chemotaxis response regulator CheB